MKNFWIGLLFFVLLFCGCSPLSVKENNVPVPVSSPTSTMLSKDTPLPKPTLTTQIISNPELQRIETEIFRLADEYSTKVEQFRQNEQAEIIIDPQTGKETMDLSQQAIEQLIPLYEYTEEKIHDLDQEYWNLYQKEHIPEPLPMNLSKDELKQAIKRAEDEFNVWLSKEMQSGKIIKYFDPGQKVFVGGLIAESSALYRWKWAYIVRLSALYAAPEQDLMRLDIQNIQRIEPGEVTYMSRSANPAYRVDIDLTTYETATARYDVYTETHEVIEIVAKSPVTDTAGERAALEKRAREWVALISPGWNIENLAFTYNEKVNVYFFRWTDTSKPLLDDGRTHPFIQVGLNGNGELLTYYNTLPLSR